VQIYNFEVEKVPTFLWNFFKDSESLKKITLKIQRRNRALYLIGILEVIPFLGANTSDDIYPDFPVLDSDKAYPRGLPVRQPVWIN